MSVSLAFRPILGRIKGALLQFKFRLGCNARGVVVAHSVSLLRVELGEYANIAHHADLSDARVGKRTSVGRYTKVRCADIGSYCSISWDVTIGAVGHYLDRPSTHAFTYRAQFRIVDSDSYIEHERVQIGNDVWIGCGAIIMPGVSVGNGAVIGAGAVVTKDVAPYAIVSGVPARLMRFRFEPELIERLEALSWWDWNDAKLRSSVEFFKSPLGDDSLAKLLKEER